MDDLHHLSQLAVRLKLPRDWIRHEALAGRLPCLRVGRRLVFSFAAVTAALAERAACSTAPSSGQPSSLMPTHGTTAAPCEHAATLQNRSA